MEEVISELRRLRPEQVDEVARITHDLSQTRRDEGALRPAVPAHVVGEAVRHGWHAELIHGSDWEPAGTGALGPADRGRPRRFVTTYLLGSDIAIELLRER